VSTDTGLFHHPRYFFDIFLKPSSFDVCTRPGQRKAPPNSAWTINDVSPPAGLPTAQLQTARLKMHVGSTQAKSSNTDNSNGAEDRSRDRSCLTTETGSLELPGKHKNGCSTSTDDRRLRLEMIEKVCKQFCFGSQPRSDKQAAWQECFEHSLCSVFPAAFSRSYLKLVIERARLAPSIQRSMSSFVQRRAACKIQGAAKTSSRNPSHSTEMMSPPGHSQSDVSYDTPVWLRILTVAAKSCMVDDYPQASLRTGGSAHGHSEHRRSAMNPINNDFAAQSDETGSIQLVADFVSDFEQIHAAERDATLHHHVFTETPNGSASLADEHRSIDTCCESLLREACGGMAFVGANVDDWPCGTLISPVSSQSSIAQSEILAQQMIPCLGQSSERFSANDEWEMQISECQRLSQSSGSTASSELLTIIESSPEQHNNTSFTSLENYLEASHFSDLSSHNISETLESGGEDLSTRDLSGYPKSRSSASELPLHQGLGAEDNCLFEAHSIRTFSASQNMPESAPLRMATHSNPGTPQQSRRSSILSFGSMRRSNSSNSTDNGDLRNSELNTFSLHGSFTPPTDAKPCERRSSLLRRLTRTSAKLADDKLATEIFSGRGSQNRDFEVKRRKTLDDYTIADDQDDEDMLLF
jgi:hypothetical protein